METKVDRLGYASITLNEDEQRLHDWGGETVAMITVKRKDGKEARFWLSINIPDDTRAGIVGDCYATLRARFGENGQVRTARSPWRNYDS